MKKPLFTLFFGDEVQFAPTNKIVKAEEFSKTLELQDMIQHIKDEEQKYRIKVASECEEIKEQAQREGFEEGLKQWADLLALLEAERAKVRDELEKILTPITLKAAKKIVGREIKLHSETIVDIVSNVLKTVAQHKKIVIYANSKDLEILEANRPNLKQLFESLESLSLRPQDDIETGGCIIETEGGIINARLENQWKILEEAFKSMFSKEALEKLLKIEKIDEKEEDMEDKNE